MSHTIKVVAPEWQKKVYYIWGQGNIEMLDWSIWKLPDTMNSHYFMPTNDKPQFIINCADCDPLSIIKVQQSTSEKSDDVVESAVEDIDSLTKKELVQRILDKTPDADVKNLKRDELVDLYQLL